MPTKKDNKDESHPRSYRPINLISTMLKLYERCILEKISIIVHNNIDHRQYGFRPHKGCSDHLVTLVTDIREAHDKGHTVGIVSLDATQAFERVEHDDLLEKMIKIGIPGKLVKRIIDVRYSIGKKKHQRRRTQKNQIMAYDTP